MKKSLLWSDEYLLALIDKVDEKCFWYPSKNEDIIINKHLLLREFCPSIGIFNLPLGEDSKGCQTFTPVFIRGNRIQEVNGNTIQNIIERILELWDVEKQCNEGDKVVAKLGFCLDIFEKKGLGILVKKKGVEIFKDTATSAYVFFKNGFKKITAKEVYPLTSYEDIPANKFIWESRIIPNDYVTEESVIKSLDLVTNQGTDPASGEYLSSEDRILFHKQLNEQLKEESQRPDTHFLDFLHNLARDEEGEVCKKSLTRIQLALGYLSHRYNIPDMMKWVYFVDRNVDFHSDKANGGNGKSILLTSLSNFLNFTQIDGREFKKSRDDRFAFSNVSASTDIVYFDDAAKDFDWKLLYAKATGSFEVAVKHKNTFTIPIDDSPKLAISSNYPLTDDDDSTQRRNFQIEVSDFYKTQLADNGLRVADIHGGKLIARKDGGWNAVDWSHYYDVICDSISLYLQKGLPLQAEESITFKRNRLCAEMPVSNKEELLDYLLAYLKDAAESGEEKFAAVFYKETREQFTFPEHITGGDLYELLKKVDKSFRLIPNHSHKNSKLIQQRLTGDRKQRWVDAGMQDYLDQNENNPLEEKDSKVYCFTVTPFQTAQDVFKGHKPIFNKSGDEVTVS